MQPLDSTHWVKYVAKFAKELLSRVEYGSYAPLLDEVWLIHCAGQIIFESSGKLLGNSIHVIEFLVHVEEVKDLTTQDR